MTSINLPVRAFRNLTAAEGYLELDLPELALEALLEIKEPGPLTVPCLFLVGETLKKLERYDEAIAPLRQAACSLPSPLSAIAWQSVADCLQKSGRDASSLQPTETARVLAGSVSQMSIVRDKPENGAPAPHFGGVTLTLGKNISVTITIQLAKSPPATFGR